MDPKTGKLMTHAPTTYKIPTANDCPPVFNVALFDNATSRTASTAARPSASRRCCCRSRCSSRSATRSRPSAIIASTRRCARRPRARRSSTRSTPCGEAAHGPRRRLAATRGWAAHRPPWWSRCRKRRLGPRGAGTRMLVSAAQATAPSAAATSMRRGRARARCSPTAAGAAANAIRSGPALGQCCGGVVHLAFALLDDSAIARWPQGAADAPADARRGPCGPRHRHAAGHAGRALRLDRRARHAFPPTTTLGTPWPDSIRRLVADGAEGEVAGAPAGAYFLVLTHDHALDLRIAEAALRRDDAGFVGVIGSKSKRERFRHRLAQRGMDDGARRPHAVPRGRAGHHGQAARDHRAGRGGAADAARDGPRRRAEPTAGVLPRRTTADHAALRVGDLRGVVQGHGLEHDRLLDISGRAPGSGRARRDDALVGQLRVVAQARSAP